jgi:hypothetical protein
VPSVAAIAGQPTLASGGATFSWPSRSRASRARPEPGDDAAKRRERRLQAVALALPPRDFEQRVLHAAYRDPRPRRRVLSGRSPQPHKPPPRVEVGYQVALRSIRSTEPAEWDRDEHVSVSGFEPEPDELCNAAADAEG